MRIDAFDGLLLAATNRLETIDAAVLRRFDAKVRFDYMKADHALEMLEAVLGDGPPIGASERQRLAQLDRLTPGDFRTALRQLRIRGTEVEAGALIDALEAEVQGKPGVDSKGIGFLASIGGASPSG
jgi:SpoVK/Ycf46/Vps4 family AAA+-type ATPase